MEQYINKSALVAEINKDVLLTEIEKSLKHYSTSEDLEDAAYKASLNNFVDPKCLDDELRNFDWIRYYEQVFKTGALWQKQQDTIEVKDVDLDYIKKELDKVVRIYKPNGDFGWGTLYNVATYFYELGIKAQKGE